MKNLAYTSFIFPKSARSRMKMLGFYHHAQISTGSFQNSAHIFKRLPRFFHYPALNNCPVAWVMPICPALKTNRRL